MKKALLSLVLVVSMVFTVLPVNVSATEDDTLDEGTVYKITAINELDSTFEKSEPFDGYSYALSVEKGRSEKELNLPDELLVSVERTSLAAKFTDDDGNDSSESEEVTNTEEETIVSETHVYSPSDTNEENTEEGTSTATTYETEKIFVSWKSNTEYNPEEGGVVIFTPQFPEGYTLANGVNPPQIHVVVGTQMHMAETILSTTATVSIAEEYGIDANNVTDYTVNGTTFIIKTAKGAAFWSANAETYLDYTIKLNADIDVSGFQWTPIGQIDMKGNPISFTGTFDGQGHTISGMNFANNVQVAGVFGSTSKAIVKNLTVSGNINVTEAGNNWVDENPGFAAGIVCIASDTSISNCYSKVQITIDLTAPFAVGGIVAVAQNNVIIDSCSNNGGINVDAANMTFIGGIVGDMELLTASSSIKNCANTGALTADVTSTSGQMSLVYLGGIVGMKSGDENHEDINAVVENCYNAGALDVTTSGIAYVGGIAGNNYGDKWERISNCYNAGTVNGTATIQSFDAGIVGSNMTGSVYNSYWKVDTANNCVQYLGQIYNCGTFDAAGTLSATTDENAGTTNAEHGLSYGDNLLTALNSWVEAQTKPSDYKTWVVKSGVNNGYPIFGVENGDSTFDFCNGAPTVSEKPSDDPTWGTTGYAFDGWYTKPNGEGSKLTGDGDGGFTYYAKWTVGTGETLRTVRTTALDLRDQTSDEDKLSTQGWAWYFNANTDLNYAAKTLVLSDMTINTANATALYVPDGTTIVLIENTINTVKSGDVTSVSEAVFVYGVYSPGELTIRGSGTLNATAGKATSIEKRSESYGIFSLSINIQDGTITGNGGSDAGGSYGILSQINMVISGGTVTGKGSSANYESIGLLSSFLKITGGTVEGMGDAVSGGYGYGNTCGICSTLIIDISGGTVKGISGTASTASTNSYGIYNRNAISITGGTVEGIGGNAGKDSYGICCVGGIGDIKISLTISGGTVTAKNGIASNQGAIGIFNSSSESGSSATLTVGSAMRPARIANATDGMAAITTSSGIIGSGKLVMSGSDAVTIRFMGHTGHTVTFDANGGEVTPVSQVTGVDGMLSSMPTPTRSGSYSFKGWFTEASGGNGVITNTVFDADTTIYAHWRYSGGGGSDTPSVDNKPKMVVTVPVEVSSISDSEGNAIVTITQAKLNEILSTAQKIAAEQGAKENGIVAELTVNFPADTESLIINLPKRVQDGLVKENVEELKIHSSGIEISFDKAAIGKIQSNTRMDAQIIVKPYTVLSDEAEAAIGSRPVFDLTLTYGNKTMSSFGTGKVYVGIPYILDKNEQADNIAVVYVNEEGKVTWLTQSGYDSARKLAFFTTDHFSAYGVAYKPDTPTFSDIDGHWAKDDILFVANKELFRGIEKDKFGPDLPMTRGMFVSVLGRLAQVDVSGYKESGFFDVSTDAYYMAYVKWANKNGIVNGIGDGKYAPDAVITREQLAVMIDRYAALIGFQLPTAHAKNIFADEVKMSGWAKEAVRRVQMAGIINGKTDNLFDPKGIATRAEVSAVLKRFIKLAKDSGDVQG